MCAGWSPQGGLPGNDTTPRVMRHFLGVVSSVQIKTTIFFLGGGKYKIRGVTRVTAVTGWSSTCHAKKVLSFPKKS